MSSRNQRKTYFKEREVWYCDMGETVGREERGKGKDNLRPAVILKKYSADLFLGILLTTRIKDSKYLFYIGQVGGKEAAALISHTRTLSSERLKFKIGKVSPGIFEEMKLAARKMNFGS